MIGIKECCPNIEVIYNKHVDFVSKRVESIIDFYISVFETFDRKRFKTKVDVQYYLSTKKENLDGKGTTAKSLVKVLFNKKATYIDDQTIYGCLFDESNLKTNLLVLKNKLKYLKVLKYYARYIIGIKLTDKHYGKIHRENYNEMKLYFEPINNLLPKIFNYDSFIDLSLKKDWSAYKLTKALNLKVCPYCNIHYTYTVSKGAKKITRPELDHFLEKSTHKLLALSFYNLIPSCKVCNSSLKGQTKMDFDKYLSPYEDNENHSLLNYDYYPKSVDGALGKTEDIDICVKPKAGLSPELGRKVEGNINLFKYKEISVEHKDVVKDIIHKNVISHDSYLLKLSNTFPSLTYQEAYRYAYGTYGSEKDFAKRAFSKLTKDIAFKLSSIKTFKQGN